MVVIRTFRYLLKNKVQTIINIIGLTIGISGALLIFVFVLGLTSVEKFHENGARLFQVITETPRSNSNDISPATSALLAGTLIEEIPEIKGVCRTVEISSEENRIGFVNESFNYEGMYADPSLFELFTFPFIKGSQDAVRGNNQTIMMSEEMANKLFGDSDAINQEVMLFNADQYKPETLTVTGVFRNIPANSTFRFDYVIPFDHCIGPRNWIMSWGNVGTRTYVQLLDGANASLVADKITDIIKTKENTKKDTKMFLLSVKDKLLWQSPTTRSPIYYVGLILSLIAGSILFIAIFNFINLSTYNSLKRSREVGVRKVSGAGITTLTRQFIFETATLVVFASLLALLLSYLLLPNIGEAFGEEMFIPFGSPIFIAGFIFIIVFTSLVSGWIPSYQMCRINPVKALKGNSHQKSGKGSIRSLLGVCRTF